MDTHRCTALTLKAMYYNFYEVWISTQPFLLVTYITQYCPMLSRALFAKYFGPLRVNALRTGKDLYDVNIALGLKQ